MTTTPYPLGRHVNHDPRSRAFAYDASAVPVQLASVRWDRQVPTFDQGNLGSCTGNAAVGCIGTHPFFETLPANTALDEKVAISVYSDATKIDSAPGSYPPTDTGSDGLSVAKVLTNRGLISGYTHAFTFADALAALSNHPIIVGVNWYQNMFQPDANGVVTIPVGDTIAGGHEFVLDEINVEKQLVGAQNSWGTGWGVDGGRFYIPFTVLKRLLSEQGDATVFVPVNAPVPVPTPPPAPIPVVDPVDQNCWDSVKPWALGRHTGQNKAAANTVKAWAKTKGLL